MATSAWGKPAGAWATAVEDEEKESGAFDCRMKFITCSGPCSLHSQPLLAQ